MFDINWANIINWLMHPALRTEFNVNFINALLWPFQELYNLFTNFRNDNIYRLNHSSQVCYIRAVLNDAFDITERRITVVNAGGLTVNLLYPDLDLKEILLQPDPDDTLLIYQDSAYNGGEYDFIVNVPFSVSEAQLYQMESLLNKYKLASKRYDIITI